MNEDLFRLSLSKYLGHCTCSAAAAGKHQMIKFNSAAYCITMKKVSMATSSIRVGNVLQASL
jgi:hypothetical protein